MKSRMLNQGCACFLAGSILLLVPTAAGAVAGEGIRLGPALLSPVLSLSATYDDNIELVSENPQDGWVTSIAPSLRLALPLGSFSIEAEGGIDFRSYYEVKERDTTNWYVGAGIGASFPGGLSFKIADKQTQRYLTGSQEYGTGEDSSVNTLTAMLAYAVGSSTRLELSGLRTAPSYDVSIQRERVETTVKADVYWKFRPATSALLEGSYAEYGYESNTAQNGSATMVALGLTWDVTARSTGFIKAGYQWKSYDQQDAALGTRNGDFYVFSGGLKHSFSPRTMLGIDLSRASQESDFPNNPYFVSTTVGANLSLRLTTKFYGRASARYGYDEYANSTSYDNPYDTGSGVQSGQRTDTAFGWGASLGFDMTRWASLELGYAGEQRDSSFDTFDYTATRFTLSAKFAL